MQNVNVSIKGIAPLLQHKMPEEDVNASVRRTSDKQGDDPADFLYMCGKKICQPATHIERAIVQAASGFKVVGRGKKTYKDAAKCVFVSPDMIEHAKQKWEPRSDSVVIPSTKGRVLRKRPMLKEWELSFELTFDEKLMPPEVLKRILDSAGESIGIGDWRPNVIRCA